MQRSLRSEFEASQRWPWLKVAIGAAIVLAVASAWSWRPVPTLRNALANVDVSKLEQPFRNRRLEGLPFGSWNWVDASRRAELVASMPNAEATVDVMLNLAAGKTFLFYPSLTQGFVPTASGPVFVSKLSWDKMNGIARDERGGPVLDLAPFKPKPTVVAVPFERLADFVRRDADGKWQFYLAYEGQRPEDQRSAWPVHDPIAALTFLKRAQP